MRCVPEPSRAASHVRFLLIWKHLHTSEVNLPVSALRRLCPSGSPTPTCWSRLGAETAAPPASIDDLCSVPFRWSAWRLRRRIRRDARHRRPRQPAKRGRLDRDAPEAPAEVREIRERDAGRGCPPHGRGQRAGSQGQRRRPGRTPRPRGPPELAGPEGRPGADRLEMVSQGPHVETTAAVATAAPDRVDLAGREPRGIGPPAGQRAGAVPFPAAAPRAGTGRQKRLERRPGDPNVSHGTGLSLCLSVDPPPPSSLDCRPAVQQ